MGHLLTQETLTTQGLNRLNGLTIIMTLTLGNWKTKKLKKYYKFKNEETFKLDEGESAITYIEQEEDNLEYVYSSSIIATTFGKTNGNKNIQKIKGKVNLLGNIKNKKNVVEITHDTYKKELTKLLDKWNNVVIRYETEPQMYRIEYMYTFGIYFEYGTIEEVPVIMFDSYKTIIDDERKVQVPKR